MRKIIVFAGLIFVLGLYSAGAQNANDPALRAIINNFGARNYAPGAVTRAELDIIIQAGQRAPSAGNRQPWYFTVVQDEVLAKKLLSQFTQGNALIVVSGPGDSKTNGPVILDCALAAQSMYLAAQAIGLGSRLYTAPIDNINNNFKGDLGLPAGHSAVIVLRVGKMPAGVDAVSSASPRNETGRMVTYK